jgi:hypothetical protein
MNVENLDWNALERLRGAFISGTAGRSVYWKSVSDLASYDASFGERIGWKWDAVLAELQWRGWQPPTGAVYDFGCGSGVAGRRVVQKWGVKHFPELRVQDRSSLAEQFALERAKSEFPELKADRFLPDESIPDASGSATLVISHVVSELAPAERTRLIEGLPRFDAVIWVEPGTHADSHALVEVREALRTRMRIIAPCTHGNACGLNAPGNEQHWCHSFGKPPGGVFADGDWVRFGQKMGIDLRSLPYSFLVLDRRPSAPPGTCESGEISRILGHPRMYKGYAKLFNCRGQGVEEITFQRRVNPAMFKRLERGTHSSLFRWTLDGAAVRQGSEVGEMAVIGEPGVEVDRNS